MRAISLIALLVASPALAQETGGVWQGGYVGIDGGYSWGKWSGTMSYKDELLYKPILGIIDHTDHSISGANSVITGAHIGHNWQLDKLVWGLELDGAWTNAKSSGVLVPYPQDPGHGTGGGLGTPDWGFGIEQSWQSALRVRMGYAPGWGALFYGTMGPAVSGFHETHTVLGYGDAWTAATRTSHDDKIKLGWTAGAGAEWAFAPHLTLRGEYLYTSYSNVGGVMTGWPVATYGPPTDGFKGDFTTHTIRAGLNYAW